MPQENWTNIHKEFGEEKFFFTDDNKTYQQIWEENSLTYQDAQEWIKARFKPTDYNQVIKWKNHNFTPCQVKSWIDIGLNKWNDKDIKFASYLRWKGYQHSLDLNWKQLKEKGIPAQEYLDCFYLQTKRKEIKKLDIHGENLKDSLDLSDFNNLEELNCSSNQLTILKLDNCLKLKSLDCQNNQLAQMSLVNCNRLENLDCSNNNFSEQNLFLFSHLVNLERLEIGNTIEHSFEQEKTNQSIYNRFCGSLEPLKNLIELRRLNTRNTDINKGLEYLPKNIREFFCSADKRKDAKIKVLDQELKKYNDCSYCWDCENYMYNFSRIFLDWKQDNPKLIQNAQQIMELENILVNLSLIKINPFRTSRNTLEALPVFIFQTEEKVKELKKENEDHYQALTLQPPKSN